MCNKEFDTKEFDTNAEAMRYAFEAEEAGYHAVIDIIAVGVDDEAWVVEVYPEDASCETCGSHLSNHDVLCYEELIDVHTDARRGK